LNLNYNMKYITSASSAPAIFGLGGNVFAEEFFCLVKLFICGFKFFDLSREFVASCLNLSLRRSDLVYSLFILGKVLAGGCCIVESLDGRCLFFQFHRCRCIFGFLCDQRVKSLTVFDLSC